VVSVADGLSVVVVLEGDSLFLSDGIVVSGVGVFSVRGSGAVRRVVLGSGVIAV